MNDFDKILQYIHRIIELTPEESAQLCSLLTIKKVVKKQFIVQPDFVCKHQTFVVSGAMRAYLIDQDGHDHTISFAVEDWWISDYNSYIFQQPATLFVEALEDTIIIQLEYESEKKLLELVPKFERFFRIVTQRAFGFLQKRMLSNLSKSAEQRYEEFIEKYPHIPQRIPQYALASYLGMSTEYLSKLRKKQTTKKS